MADCIFALVHFLVRVVSFTLRTEVFVLQITINYEKKMCRVVYIEQPDVDCIRMSFYVYAYI